MAEIDYGIYIFPIISAVVSGVVIALVTQIVAYRYAKKNLAEQSKNNLKVVRMQLFHADRKEAILRLDDLLKKEYKTYPDFEKALKEFLDGGSGLFLPEVLKQELKREMSETDKLVRKFELDMYGEPPDVDDRDDESYDNWFENLPPWEKLDIKIKNDFTQLENI